MEQLQSIDDFKELHERLNASRDTSLSTIVISAGTCGQASGANDIIRITKKEILQRGLTEQLSLRITGCHGFCAMEPSVLIEPTGTLYPRVDIDQMVNIVDAVEKGRIVEELLYRDEVTGAVVEKQADLPFYKKQVRTILSRSEKVDPIRVYNCIENGGYASLAKALEQKDPEWVLNEVKNSGLRGRGGAGFPTGFKWELLRNQKNGGGKYLVCNADEGDPGAYMDRSVLEGNPHSILEGMIIGAYATGASNGVIYVRNEYPLAIKHLIIALRQARELGLLGEDILGTGFSFDIEIVRGAGAFVCGEETALIRSIEGRMGEPRQRPPYPVQRGINGKPTAINNVETWANIPVIIEQGAENFARVGTKNNSGTKIFSLVGKIKNTGLVEVPMGITIEEIVYDIGGGPSGKYKIKAVQTGGPSGGCIPANMFDLPIDYDSLNKVGSIMGSGGMIVMDESTCMVDVAKYFTNFLKDESCGKCFSCRKGTQRMHELLDDITRGNAPESHLRLLEELGEVIRDTTMCGLGQSAPNPVLSTLRYFRDEYKQHVDQKHCGAFVCKELVGAPCQTACPIDTQAWKYIAHISRGEYEDAYRVIRDANPFPSVCARVCSHPCESHCRSGTSGTSPIAIRALKRFITDRIDPAVYKPRRMAPNGNEKIKIGVIGSGPAGLTAAHYLSLRGYKVTVFEQDTQPGGMLVSGIAAYRLPRDVLQKEIMALIDENVTVNCGTALGKDVTVDGLMNDGYKAVFLAMGAHKSRKLNLENEEVDGVYPALEFLKKFNLQGENHAKGRVGVIGGGDSAVDAARVALRQEGVESVTLLYRRTRQEMPALTEEIEAALKEGITLETLVSPTRIILTDNTLTGIECIKNELGGFDSSGRRRPVPVEGSEYTIPLDTLIVTIGDSPDIECLETMGIEFTGKGTIKVDPETLATNRDGVFAGGDVVTGPNTVVEAIAAGKKVASVIDQFAHGKDLILSTGIKTPEGYIEPPQTGDEEIATAARVKPATIPLDKRQTTFEEVEQVISETDAVREARRCLRCDLEFTARNQSNTARTATGGKTA